VRWTAKELKDYGNGYSDWKAQQQAYDRHAVSAAIAEPDFRDYPLEH
jgi:hypothetical protein